MPAPTVLVVEDDQGSDLESGPEAGADDHTTKPLELVERVNALLSR